MVNNSVNIFEKGMIALEPHDMQIKEQFEQYRIKSISPNGRPTYTDENEHYVDAVNLCLYGFAKQYDTILRQQIAKKFSFVKDLDKELKEIELLPLIDNRENKIAKTQSQQPNVISIKKSPNMQVIKKVFAPSSKYGRGINYKGRSQF